MPQRLFTCRWARAIRKKSQMFKESATASSAQQEAAQKRRCRKGAALKTGLEVSDRPTSEPSASFLAKEGEQAP